MDLKYALTSAAAELSNGVAGLAVGDAAARRPKRTSAYTAFKKVLWPLPPEWANCGAAWLGAANGFPQSVCALCLLRHRRMLKPFCAGVYMSTCRYIGVNEPAAAALIPRYLLP